MIICPHCQAINDDHNTICVRCGGSLIDDPALAGDPYVGRRFGRRFALQRIIGSGEIGMVYQGIDEKSDQPVAVKIVHPDVAAIHGDELLRWARRVSQIRHAKVATVLGASREADGAVYIVSEFIEGETLSELVARVGPLSAKRAADILFQLCSALAPIHRVGRPHANLKPGNVFLVAGQKGDFVKVTDTGSPVLFGVHHTDRGPVTIGAPKFFSPEQASGEEAGLASDQFTVGIIGYQLLTGALPFFGATPDQLLHAIIHNTPTAVVQRAPGTPPALAAVIERCLAKSPGDRYPDLRSLAKDFAGVIKAGPSAPPARPKRRFGAGRDMSTVVARPDTFTDDMTGFTAADAEATVMQAVPDDIQSLLDAAEQTPGPMGDPSMGGDDLDEVPFGIGGSDDDLAAALADAAAAVGSPVAPRPTPQPRSAPQPRAPSPPRGAPRPRAPSPPIGAPQMRAPSPPRGAPLRSRRTADQHSTFRPSGPALSVGGDDPLAAALAEAEAELNANDGGPDAFDPFAGLDLDATPAPATARRPTPPAPARIAQAPSPSVPSVPSAPSMPAAAASVSGGFRRLSSGDDAAGVTRSGSRPALKADDILSAIGEELGGPAAPAPPEQVASPLATAADFAKLSVPPSNVRSVNTGPNPTLTGPIQTAHLSTRRSPALLLVLLLLVAGAGVAVYVFVLAPANDGTSGRRTPPPRAQKPTPDPPKPATPQALDARLVTDPPGVAVFEGEKKLGVTPLDLSVAPDARRALVLKAEGRPDTPFVLDGAQLDAGAGEGPIEVEVALKAEGGAPPTGDGAAGAAGEAAAGGAAGGAGDAPAVKKDNGTKPAGRKRTRRTRRKKTPDVNDLRDPFANP